MCDKYVLIFKVDAWPDNGGGLFYEYFSSVIDMDTRINDLMKNYRELFSITLAGKLGEEYKYAPVEVVKKLGRVEQWPQE